MTVIKKKIWKEYFDSIASGKKKFELRLADFEVTQGDVLLLEEWDKDTEEYTGRSIEKMVTLVNKFSLKALEDFWPKEELDTHGIQIISIE